MIKKHLLLAILALWFPLILGIPVESQTQPIEDEKLVDSGLPIYARREDPEPQDLPGGIDNPAQEVIVGVAPEAETGDLETANTFWGIGRYGGYGYPGYGWNPYYWHQRRGWGGGWGGRRGWGWNWGRGGYW